MDFSPQQERALAEVADWHKRRSKPYFYLAGFAGTGKTTLAKHFAESCGGVVHYAAYTGKAAEVMRRRGCKDATTIHRLIYQPTAKGTAKLRQLQEEMAAVKDTAAPAIIERLRRAIVLEIAKMRSPGFNLKEDSKIRGASLVIVDECSMVNPQMGEDLLSFNCPILVLGDPAQLPPVRGAGYFTRGEPDFMLTEVHRQAASSGILRMATEIRQGNMPSPGTDYGNAKVITRAEVDPKSMLEFDQILVGKNSTRKGTNKRVRSLLGITDPLPIAGDKVICLRNNHDLGLLNGGLWKVLHAEHMDEKSDLVIEDDDNQLAVSAWSCIFQGEDLDRYDHSNETQEFDYGYVLTVHKAQGSEWGKVAVFDESDRVARQNPRSWLYTAVTRAADDLLLVK